MHLKLRVLMETQEEMDLNHEKKYTGKRYHIDNQAFFEIKRWTLKKNRERHF